MARSILLHFSGDERHDVKTGVAIKMARLLGAGITGLYVNDPQYGPRLPEGFVGEEAEAIRARMEAVRGGFQNATKLNEVAAEWHVQRDEARSAIAFYSRFADLVVMGQSAPKDADQPHDLPNDVVMAVGCPLLVVPHAGAFESVGARVLVAWNNSRVASRALGDAMPILEQAEEVTVLSVNAKSTDHPTSADMRDYLAQRGITAQAENMVTRKLDTGSTLLSKAHDLAIDLIVTGAYGGSRIRESLVGGTTRHLFENMTRPVLFSH